MAFRVQVRSLALAGAVVALAATPALADKIDGDWCLGTSSFHIEGSAIRPPGGHDTLGDYSRHAFRYISPADEKDAGAEIVMRLLNEETLQLMRRIGGTDGPVETWQRCKPVS